MLIKIYNVFYLVNQVNKHKKCYKKNNPTKTNRSKYLNNKYIQKIVEKIFR